MAHDKLPPTGFGSPVACRLVGCTKVRPCVAIFRADPPNIEAAEPGTLFLPAATTLRLAFRRLPSSNAHFEILPKASLQPHTWNGPKLFVSVHPALCEAKMRFTLKLVAFPCQISQAAGPVSGSLYNSCATPPPSNLIQNANIYQTAAIVCFP